MIRLKVLHKILEANRIKEEEVIGVIYSAVRDNQVSVLLTDGAFLRFTKDIRGLVQPTGEYLSSGKPQYYVFFHDIEFTGFVYERELAESW